MTELGAISSYKFAVQQVQMSIIKNEAEMQQQIVEILNNSDGIKRAPGDKGSMVDVEL